MCLISPDVFRSSVKDGCFISFNYFFSFHYNRGGNDVQGAISIREVRIARFYVV